jgi:hypothetical protein
MLLPATIRLEPVWADSCGRAAVPNATAIAKTAIAWRFILAEHLLYYRIAWFKPDLIPAQNPPRESFIKLTGQKTRLH